MRLALLALMLAAAPAVAQVPDYRMDPIPAPALAGSVPLYAEGSLPAAAVPESWSHVSASLPGGGTIDGGRAVRNVSVPTIIPVLPDPAKATGAAVLVAPGGAFVTLAIDDEGFKVARWLADHGVAAFVLKYRLTPTAADLGAFQKMMAARIEGEIRTGTAGSSFEPMAPKDALQALKVIRAGAARWNFDPARVGMIGFSAGAITTLQTVLSGPADGRPAFVGYIYGAMRPVDVPAGAPPMFAALALDDPLFGHQGFGIVDSWRKAGARIELHAYQAGGHGFGTGRPGTTTTLVLDEFRLWMETNGWLKR